MSKSAEFATTILVADDETPLLELIGSLLQQKGYEVLVAHDGAQALEIARSHSGQIDLLLSDVVMPKLEGPALAASVQTLRPSTRILLMSGCTPQPVALEAGWKFIRKPFPPKDLLDQIGQSLEEPAAV